MNEQYILCEVIEREISTPIKFDNRDDAVQAMLKLVRKVLNINEVELAAYRGEDGVYDLPDGEANVETGTAYCTWRHMNYDWQIFQL